MTDPDRTVLAAVGSGSDVAQHEEVDVNEQKVEKLDIEAFTASRIEGAAETQRPKKRTTQPHVDPVKPKHDTKTNHMVYTYLNER